MRKPNRPSNHHCKFTPPLLHEQLGEWGVELSVGQIDALLSAHTAVFCVEKDQRLVTGLQVIPLITVDDSGPRHQGQNGYVTQIGNTWFAWFSSIPRKRRINFLALLHAGDLGYGLNTHKAAVSARFLSAAGSNFDIVGPPGTP